MPRILLILLACLPLATRLRAQSHSQAHAQQPALNVGDIPFDPALDDPDFHLADSNRVFQYYNSTSWWLDHKSTYRAVYMEATRALHPNANQSGWLTIRFIINRAAETGRFRLLEMDSTYQPWHFDTAIVNCLLKATKTLSWVPAHYNQKIYDTYQYITFHLQQGHIIDITP